MEAKDGTPQLRRLPCQRCGNAFDARRKDAKFCPDCKQRAKLDRDAATLRMRREDGRAGARPKPKPQQRSRQCADCGEPVWFQSRRCRACNGKRQSGAFRREDNPNWKGGRIRSRGYILVRVYEPDGQVRRRPEHIVLWEQLHGQPLPDGWVVHHLNGIKDDNRPENLAGMSRQHHHSHPRDALRPYEHRIRELEELVRQLGGDPGRGPDAHEHGHQHGLDPQLE